MVLTDLDIVKMHQAHAGFIVPFDEGHLSDTSYDLSLGTDLHELTSSAGVLYLDDEENLRSMYVRRDISRGYILKPGQFVLCSLREFISLPDDVLARVMPRTRLSRLGIQVSNQLCHPSYEGRLELGVTNLSSNNVTLVEGLKIAQIVFERLDHVPSGARLYRNQRSAAYQDEDGFRGATFAGEELSVEAREIFNDLMARLSGDEGR